MENFVVTIDGPAGAGKSTVARRVAEALGVFYLDTGAMYRSVGLLAARDGRDPVDVARTLRFEIVYSETGEKRILADGEDVTLKIRTPEADKEVSRVAAIREVRKHLIEKQRFFARGRSIVLEGRDTGSVVFPDARFKFYLDASVEERARRRYDQLVKKTAPPSLEEIEADIIRRDTADKNRPWGALTVPDQAHVVDTTNLTIEEVVEEILSHIKT
ncbi:MAG TPA: (d)CMP kinase [Candidatus Mcinerneyibacteriales bacterium]|jgi:cytidylate kinase|nr:(d)CMP kinase [Candidatus Mcinerneyibacteriales bacterium]